MEQLPQLIREARVAFFSTTGTMAEMQGRIFDKGELSKGGKIQYKEDYEVYIYKPPFPQKPKGKGKRGAKIKGEWQPSYVSAKRSQGRGETPFELTGDLRLAWIGGPQPAPKEVDPLICEIRMPEKEAMKAAGLAKQKGEFLRLTDGERASHTERVRDLYREIL